MRYCSRLFAALVPTMMLASVACAPAVPAVPPVSITATSAAAASPALPQADDLTFGQNAGKVLVGLTVRPAQPGPNTLLVYVLPLEGPAAAADVPLSLAVSGQNGVESRAGAVVDRSGAVHASHCRRCGPETV